MNRLSHYLAAFFGADREAMSLTISQLWPAIRFGSIVAICVLLSLLIELSDFGVS